MRLPTCWIFVLGVVACGGHGEPSGAAGSAPPPGSAAPGSAAPAPARPPDAPALTVVVGDAAPVRLTASQIARWPRLDNLLSGDARRLGTWHTVYLETGGRTVELSQPSMTYPDMIPAVFPGKDGVAFGMFDPVELARHGAPGLRQDGVTEIRLELATAGRTGEHQGGGGGDPTKLTLAVETASGARTITGTELLALPREPMPGDASHKGWRLTSLLRAAGVTTFKKLILIDAAGTSLVLERADFDDKTKIPFLKLNRKGQLRFRVLEQRGTGWVPSGDLRALARVKVS